MNNAQKPLDPNAITFINVWKTASSERQAKLLEAMKQEAPDITRMSGFYSMTLYASTDGTSLVVLTTWRSQEDYDINITNNPEAMKNRDRLTHWGEPSPNLYRVEGIFRSADADPCGEKITEAVFTSFGATNRNASLLHKARRTGTCLSSLVSSTYF